MILSRRLLRGGETTPHWVSEISPAYADVPHLPLVILPDGSVILHGVTAYPSGRNFTAQLSIHGYPDWAYYHGASNSPHAGGIAVDGAGALHIAQYAAGDLRTSKMEADGSAYTLTRLLGSASDDYPFGRCLGLDESNNVYIQGTVGTASVVIAKYDSSGALQWQRVLSGTSSPEGKGLAVNGAGDVYALSMYSATTTPTVILAKYNSGGALQWQKKLIKSATQIKPSAVALDGSDNAYVLCHDPTDNDYHLIKYNSAGTLQWQKKYVATSISGANGDLAVDGDGNSYVISNYSSSPVRAVVQKFDTDGVRQWFATLRHLGGANVNPKAIGLSAGNERLVITAGVSSGLILAISLPTDGSLNNGYTAGDYATSTTAGPTINTGSLTDATGNATDGAGALTEGSTALPTVTPYAIDVYNREFLP